MSDQVERLHDFLDELNDAGTDRLVVRWVDETRPVPQNETGYTVRRVMQATLTAQRDGELVRETFDDIDYDELRRVVGAYPFEVLYRNDNLTR